MDGFHAKVTLVGETAVTRKLVGVVGGVRSREAPSAVAEASSARSTASTRNEPMVLGYVMAFSRRIRRRRARPTLRERSHLGCAGLHQEMSPNGRPIAGPRKSRCNSRRSNEKAFDVLAEGLDFEFVKSVGARGFEPPTCRRGDRSNQSNRSSSSRPSTSLEVPFSRALLRCAMRIAQSELSRHGMPCLVAFDCPLLWRNTRSFKIFARANVPTAGNLLTQRRTRSTT